MNETNNVKPILWLSSSLDALKSFPKEVQQEMGYALYEAQIGKKSTHAKPLKGFSGASVLEIVENYDGDTYRAVYTIKFKNVLYVLHAFQKRSKKGIKTPKPELDLINQRLRIAKEHYQNP